MFYHRDPRRAQPLVDQLVEGFNAADFNAESTFDISQVLCFYRAFYEELGWRFEPWADDMIVRAWPEIGCEHDEVRSYIGEMLAVAEKAKVNDQPPPNSSRLTVVVAPTETVRPNYGSIRKGMPDASV